MARFRLRRIGPGTCSLVETRMIIKDDGTTFGRHPDNDYYLDSNILKNFISRRHARIECHNQNLDGSREYRIYDCSLNGTYVNEYRASDGGEFLEPDLYSIALGLEGALQVNNTFTTLREGDRITFGHKNGYNIKPGEYSPQPESEFHFIFEKGQESTVQTSNSADRQLRNANVEEVNFPSKDGPRWSEKEQLTGAVSSGRQIWTGSSKTVVDDSELLLSTVNSDKVNRSATQPCRTMQKVANAGQSPEETRNCGQKSVNTVSTEDSGIFRDISDHSSEDSDCVQLLKQVKQKVAHFDSSGDSDIFGSSGVADVSAQDHHHGKLQFMLASPYSVKARLSTSPVDDPVKRKRNPSVRTRKPKVVRRGKIVEPGRNDDSGINREDEDTTCYALECKRPQTRKIGWVQCDDCDQWYHTACVGCSLRKVKNASTNFSCGCI